MEGCSEEKVTLREDGRVLATLTTRRMEDGEREEERGKRERGNMDAERKGGLFCVWMVDSVPFALEREREREKVESKRHLPPSQQMDTRECKYHVAG